VAESKSAGPFGQWLTAMRAVLRDEQDADVPCGDCVGCCVSSYFIPLRPTDHAALEQVPSEFLHLPSGAGMARMGYREDGSCPMLLGGRCSIYANRPLTCRDYDCRIYAATGLLPDGDRPVIATRVLEWQFSFADEADRQTFAALQRAARFLQERREDLPEEWQPASTATIAVLAVKCCELFCNADRPPALADVVARAREFDQSS
jgi:uncharacterized protein